MASFGTEKGAIPIEGSSPFFDMKDLSYKIIEFYAPGKIACLAVCDPSLSDDTRLSLQLLIEKFGGRVYHNGDVSRLFSKQRWVETPNTNLNEEELTNRALAIDGMLGVAILDDRYVFECGDRLLDEFAADVSRLGLPILTKEVRYQADCSRLSQRVTPDDIQCHDKLLISLKNSPLIVDIVTNLSL